MNNPDTDIYWPAMSPGLRQTKLLLSKENRYKVIRSDSKREFKIVCCLSIGEYRYHHKRGDTLLPHKPFSALSGPAMMVRALSIASAGNNAVEGCRVALNIIPLKKQSSMAQ